VTHKNWGIFGMARLNKKPCVVSTHRMGKNHKDRLIKVSIHETGHSLGIPHCKNTKCVMTDAKGKGSTVDNAFLWMCDNCKSKINLRRYLVIGLDRQNISIHLDL
jgi:archaemetzincin